MRKSAVRLRSEDGIRVTYDLGEVCWVKMGYTREGQGLFHLIVNNAAWIIKSEAMQLIHVLISYLQAIQSLNKVSMHTFYFAEFSRAVGFMKR